MKNMSYAEHVAQTILGQLGSQRFVVMTGAKNLAYLMIMVNAVYAFSYRHILRKIILILSGSN